MNSEWWGISQTDRQVLRERMAAMADASAAASGSDADGKDENILVVVLEDGYETVEMDESLDEAEQHPASPELS